ncbi:hypothetical protein JN535_04330 [Cellulosimicrobium cellulans]|uniref:SDH family Clp fold serine proteinase n=1 Tax=Cellulosimicrobium cellulans TaxID=1710 RepID=UPI0019647705|nr:hypothetical protein [Cellulosimicrobium cellulans]MBN0039402.1 hypothetical protein [Cellulosimicrobium cellulans]
MNGESEEASGERPARRRRKAAPVSATGDDEAQAQAVVQTPSEDDDDPATAASPECGETDETGPAPHAILVMFQMTNDAHGSISRGVVEEVMEQVGRLPESSRGGRLDVWLESPGGDAHSAYKLGLYLRSKFSEINFVVPDYAKSAATLLSLAGDRIYMAPAAELGPLDIQEVREGEIRMRSALDTADSIQALWDEAITQVLLSGGVVLQQTGLARDKTISHLLEFAGDFMRPLLEQLDPVAIKAANTSLLVAMEYGARLLAYRTGDDLEDVYPRIERMIRRYPTHGYVIDRTEARDRLGLPVEKIEDYDLEFHCDAWHSVARNNPVSLVQLFSLAELERISRGEHDDAIPDETEADGDE